MNNIYLDSIDNWPRIIRRELSANRKKLEEYFKIEHWIDEQSEEKIQYRINRPINKRYNVYHELLRIINEEMFDKNIFGYHATRILSYEKENILKNGLELLSNDLIIKKLNFLLEHKFVPKEIYQKLLEKNQSEAFNRKNQICLFHTKNTMQSEGGLGRLLGLYGGESIYWFHSRNSEITKYLKIIGKPSIIFCSINYKENWERYDIHRRMIKYFIEEKDFDDFDSFHKKKVKVEFIIDEENSEFENLTKYSKWMQLM